jgi:hypothetical protein
MYVRMKVEIVRLTEDNEIGYIEGFGDTQDEAIQDAWREYSTDEKANARVITKHFSN